MGGFFRVTGAPSQFPATCSGSIPVPGSLEGVRDIPILPRPARMSRERWGGGGHAGPFQHRRFAQVSSQPLVTRVTLERKKELINGFKLVYSELVGEVASLATEALSGHRLRTSRQLKAKQPRCLLARPNMVTCSLPWKGWPRWCLPASERTRARP